MPLSGCRILRKLGKQALFRTMPVTVAAAAAAAAAAVAALLATLLVS